MAYIQTVAEVTLGLRNEFKREIKKYCFNRRLKLSLQEDGNWFSTQYLIKIEGPKDKILKAKWDLEQWFKRLSQ